LEYLRTVNFLTEFQSHLIVGGTETGDDRDSAKMVNKLHKSQMPFEQNFAWSNPVVSSLDQPPVAFRMTPDRAGDQATSACLRPARKRQSLLSEN
jgi:hypothetical protein